MDKSHIFTVVFCQPELKSLFIVTEANAGKVYWFIQQPFNIVLTSFLLKGSY